MGRLTTHVLDLTLGRPARDLGIELFALNGEERRHIRTVRTNADGRVDGPMLEGDELRSGEYELLFRAGDYLRAQGNQLSDPPFLDLVPIRFGVGEPDAHYHVPLLLSAHGYSTYRGS